MTNIKNKIITIVGTTASGKTTLAVDLACRFDGEIVSADSRQVYKYMDIGTGKDLDEYVIKDSKCPMGHLESYHVPHHCIDIVHPNTEFSLGKWYKKATKAIQDIQNRGKLPIIAGGTGLYTQAIVDGYQLSEVKPDKKLRERLEKLNVNALYKRLEKLDKKFAANLHESDKKNKRRLIRYVELKRIATNQKTNSHESKKHYKSITIGLTWPQEVLKKRIMKRLVERLEKEDMIGEVERLHKEHRVSWKRMIDFGLEYKYITLYLKGELNYEEMVEQLARAVYQFSRRQMTWLRRWERQGTKIHWVKNKSEAVKLVRQYISK